MRRRAFLKRAGGSALAAGAWATTTGAARTAEFAATPITKGPKHHFFGYYDKCPWDKTGRYLLANEIDFCDRQPKPGEELTVGMVDLKDGDRYIPLDKTTAWCWQQGTMLQWLGSAPDREVDLQRVDGRARRRAIDPRRARRQGPARCRGRSTPCQRRRQAGGARSTSPACTACGPATATRSYPRRFADDPRPEKLGIWWMDMKTGKNELIVNAEAARRDQAGRPLQGRRTTG